MGRTAGHLALGIGKAAGASLTIIPEEFGLGPIRLDNLVDILAGAVIKRLSLGHGDGTAVISGPGDGETRADGVAVAVEAQRPQTW